MNQSELKNTMTEVKNTLEEITSRVDDAEGPIGDLKGRVMEIIHQNSKKKSMEKKKEDSLRELWKNIKCTNIHIIGVPEEEKKKVRKTV